MFRHALVRSLVLHYLTAFNYAGPPVRIMTTPTRFVRELDRRRCKADEREARDVFGWCFQFARSTVVYVNVAKHDTLGDLLDTCAHEALHASGWAGHGNRFDAEVAEAVLA